jgi:flagellar assembly protein FliH
MLSSSRILRGLAVKGWKTYYPRQEESEISAGEKEPSSPDVPSKEEPLLPTREELERERESVLEQARLEGEEQRRKILAQAQEEAAKLQEQARQDGYAKGHREGEKAAQKIKGEAKKLLEEAHRQYEKVLTDAEPEIIRIAVSLAEKLLNTQLEVNEDLIVGIVSHCLEELPGGQEVVVRVNPRDEAVCREKLDLFRGL